MSKNGGSPRPDNHVIVLFGATGDLAKRKLLPGLFHLHAAGLLPKEYRIIGSSPRQYALTDEQFREHAEQACADFCITKPDRPVLAVVRRAPVLRGGRPGQHDRPGGGGPAGGEGDRRARSAPVITWRYRPRRSPRSWACWARPAWPRDARVIIEKPFGTDLDVGAGAEPGGARGLRRVAGVPHRPLPGQGIGRQHPGLPVRERAVRADLEPRAHPVRADRRAGDAVDRGPGRVLRRHRRLPGHGRHAPVPGAWGSWPWSRRCRCRPSTCGTRRTRSSRR